MMTATPWNRAEGISLCVAIESIAPQFGCHVALTGGLLYKPGARKDCDLVFYRIRQTPQMDVDGLFQALAVCLGLVKLSGEGWCHKATFEGKPVDCFFPELAGQGSSG